MIKKWKVKIPKLSGDAERTVYVYLPDSYLKNPQQRYPVMYMFDGHNVFFDTDATYGKSWGMKKYMDLTKKQFIIVAVECNHEGSSRLQEYSPFNFTNSALGKIRGKGRAYFNWLVDTLKPEIDQNFPTIPNRLNTVICGSSMGGLMALYGATAFNHVFQRAACLSPSLWLNPGAVLEFIAKAHIRQDTCIYMDYGSEEMLNHAGNEAALLSTSQLLLTKHVNLTLRIVPGGRHCEASWEQQIPIFTDCLGL